MSIDDLRARLDQLLGDLGRAGDARAAAGGLYAAMVDTKTAIGQIRDALAATARELGAERQHLEDAERRGRLAAEIPDADTVELARVWATKHRERVELLTRKHGVQEDELAYAERQLAELTEQYRQARAGIPPAPGIDPDPALELDPSVGRMDRAAQAARVQEQLAELKRKLGR